MATDLNLEKAIRDNPNDSSYRLVYSDWLEDHGEMEYAKWQRAMAKDGYKVRLLTRTKGGFPFEWDYVKMYDKKSPRLRVFSNKKLPKEPGEYAVSIENIPAWVSIRYGRNNGLPAWGTIRPKLLCGRISFMNDEVGMEHLQRPQDWC